MILIGFQIILSKIRFLHQLKIVFDIQTWFSSEYVYHWQILTFILMKSNIFCISSFLKNLYELNKSETGTTGALTNSGPSTFYLYKY